jgi:hypothetical protein
LFNSAIFSSKRHLAMLNAFEVASSWLLIVKQNNLSTLSGYPILILDLFNLAKALTLVSADIQDKLLILFSETEDVFDHFSAGFGLSWKFSLRIISKLHHSTIDRLQVLFRHVVFGLPHLLRFSVKSKFAFSIS